MADSTPRPLRVFLSYPKEVRPSIREFYRRLVSEDWIDAWFDEEKLLPGQDWKLEIEQAVENADAIIVFLTKHSITREGYVQRELKLILDRADYKPEGTLFIIPIRIEECQIPHRLRTWQYTDYFPEERQNAAFQRLLKSLRGRSEQRGASTSNKAETNEPKAGYPESLKFDKKTLGIMVDAVDQQKISPAQAILQTLAYVEPQYLLQHLEAEEDNLIQDQFIEFMNAFFLIVLTGLFAFLTIEKGNTSAKAQISELHIDEAYKMAIKMNLGYAVKLIREDISARKLMLMLRYERMISYRAFEGKGIACAVDTFLLYYSEYVRYFPDLKRYR